MSLHQPTPVALAAVLLLQLTGAHAQQAPSREQTLSTVAVPSTSADASAQGLAAPFAGGQVARGGRAGVLGTQDLMATPFSITSYTNELIQDRQARSVGEVLQNDPTVRVARGFGNFQESYFIRGFILNSDDVAYNGLYSLLPRQYIATELFERVEVLRGASAFLTGANPGGGGLGGAVNLLPKRAPNEPLNRVTLGVASGGRGSVAADIARRFGPDGATGIRMNAALREGGTGIDDEKARLGLAAVGLDWRNRDIRLSGDLGFQDNRLQRTRPSVTLSGVTTVPAPPETTTNFAQPWTFSNERDLFGTLRGEWDVSPAATAWAAYGLRRSREANSLANLTVTDAATGDGFQQRFDNTRRDQVDTGELGLRGKLRTGGIGHEWLAAANWFRLDLESAFAFDFGDVLANNLYRPVASAQPAFTGASTFFGGNLDAPGLTSRTRLASYALGDTLSFAADRVRLTLGVRHQRLDLSDFDFNTGAQLARYEASRTSPAAGVVWRMAPSLSLYANYIEGLTRGATAPASNAGAPVANAGQSLPPFVSKQKEVGAKYERGGLGAGLALFTTTRPRAFVDAAGVFTAAGEDRHRGVELTAFGEPRRGLRVLGGLTWLDAEQRNTGAALTDGKRVIGVPRFQANLGAEWDVPGARGLALDGRVVHTGSRFADAANTLRVAGWTRLDLGARYLTEVSGRLVTLRARVDNVADRKHWASVGGFPGAGYLVVGAPRTVSLSASVEF